MKRKLILIQLLLTFVLSILCCFALFGCGNAPKAPEVKDVKITAVDGNSYGKAGALHEVHYTVPEGCEVSTSVKIGDAYATMADYSCSKSGYIFYTAGEYTVTVYAAKDGMLGHADAKITVHDGEASVSDVKISAAAGETLGKVGALHVITYVTNDDCDIQVEIQKGGLAATDVVFDDVYNTVIFGSAGQYTVTVTASVGTASDSASAQIEIVATEKPAVTLSLDKTAVAEDEEVTLNHTVTYAGGDSRGKESVSALYRAGTSGSYREANADTYTVNGDRFTPHVAGEWKVVYTAQSRGGAEEKAEAAFSCTPLEIMLTAKTTARQRIQTNTATDLDYLVSGAAEKYDVTFDTHGANGVTAEKGEGNSVRITASKLDYFTVTVVYTHKVKTSVHKQIDIDIYSVDSLTYSPAWGEDPFDGMPEDVLTSMGHLLYFNATTCGGAKRELTARDAKYEITENNVTASSGGTDVVVWNAADDENYPYLFVDNCDHNVARGNFTLKMTVTDPYTGYSAVATKKFNVIATTNNNTTAAQNIQSYIQQHSEFYQMGVMNFDNLSSDCRQNMVLTKTGTIMHRRNPDWALKDGNGKEDSDFAHMDFDQAAENCRLEFKFNLVAPNPASGEVWLGIGVRTVNAGGGWVGFFDLHVVDGRLGITTGLKGVSAEYVSAVEKPLPASGTTLYVRIDRRVNDDVAEYTVYVKTEEAAPYEQYYRCTANVSSSAGNAGAPVKLYQFTHRNGGGCYAVEDVVLTNYDA